MGVLVSEFADGQGGSGLPLVHWRFASLFLLPLAIYQKSSMGVGFLSDPQFLLEDRVVLAFGVFGVVHSCHAVGMPAADQPVHPLLLEPANCIHYLRLIFASERVGLLILDSISLKFKFIIRAASQCHRLSTHNSFIFALQIGAFEKLVEGDIFGLGYGCVADKWKERCESNFALIFIVFGGFEKMIALGGGVASFVAAIGHSRNIEGIAFPVGVVGFSQERCHMFGIPRVAVECSRIGVIEKEGCFCKLFRFEELLLLGGLSFVPLLH